ncbi:hypothetical protein Salmuc_02581 [Salipiger mucosus DSM 16094]|uniref:Twin-arginine translocation pathway signal n=1 Tax=Salipiger mucosus DSM 16094 TaxID=1123237 RepID=S9S0Q7_9RHOB|nr:hypothetical protein Salmuc_02581 [Salipiger mucosus DSM 16094]
MSRDLSRRAFLTRTAAVGCSLAASPLVTPVTFAATPGENRLVVIILRGAMDGLGAVMPHGDPAWAGLRGRPDFDAKDGPTDLDGFFALNGALAPLLPLWRQGELSVAHAVSTPYRDKRSHFDGQDLLEAGIADLSQGLSRDGWLNRMLSHYPGVGTETAYAVGRDSLSILSGDGPRLALDARGRSRAQPPGPAPGRARHAGRPRLRLGPDAGAGHLRGRWRPGGRRDGAGRDDGRDAR